MVFFGTYYHSLDDKSRLMIPTKLREGLTEKVYLTLGLNNYICLYTSDKYDEISKIFNTRHKLPEGVFSISRAFFGNTDECVLDKQGRVLINKNLLRFAKLDKDVVIIGNNDHIEIWDKNLYEQEEQKALEKYEQSFEKLFTGYSDED